MVNEFDWDMYACCYVSSFSATQVYSRFLRTLGNSQERAGKGGKEEVDVYARVCTRTRVCACVRVRVCMCVCVCVRARVYA